MTRTETSPLIIDGRRVVAHDAQTFDCHAPATGERLGTYPISTWVDLDGMLDASTAAFEQLQAHGPDGIASFLERFAVRLEERSEEVCRVASAETALPVEPRLRDVELPRTVAQLRRAASEARSRRWTHPVLSPEARVASMLRPLPGAVVVIGPNNFPLAFNGVSGGDAAAALATGHPVIAKAHPLHPGTSLLLAEEALAAAEETGIPSSVMQLFYDVEPRDGERLVADSRVAASAFTGSRSSGLALKRSADAAGRPIYLEMSSINPVIVLPGASRQDTHGVAQELATSTTTGSGQFCTKPGHIFVVGPDSADLVSAMASALADTQCGPLLGETVAATAVQHVEAMEQRGATIVQGGPGSGDSDRQLPATLLQVSGDRWLENPEGFQREVFGPITMLVVCESVDQLVRCTRELHGSLTGTIYSASDGSDDASYGAVEPLLARRVGRLLNDKPPTGVAVVAAMNHGGPYPATGHPGFTAVGLPRSMQRFGMLQCFDNVRDERLPRELRAENPLGITRLVETEWTDAAIVWGQS